MNIDLSSDQQKALKSLLDWFKTNSNSYITLGGYAGTGKTTLIAILRNELDKINPDLKIAFCAYTGKASRVLKNKLKEAKSMKSQDSVGTIHSLIYSPITNDKLEIVGWEVKKTVDANLIIVDEASMVDYQIWNDLLKYNKPIIAVGDHGQLPPIKGNFNLMEKPNIKLEKIHRQAEGNPIIKMSQLAREKGEIPVGNYGANIQKIARGSEESRDIMTELLTNFKSDMLVLCGYNTTRVKLNQYIRSNLGFENAEPTSGDRVICLRNNHSKEIFNGMLGKITYIDRNQYQNSSKDFYYAEIEMDDSEGLFKGSIYAPQFNNTSSLNYTDNRALIGDADLFDFGYALTVHKSQGSQAKRVILFEERFKQMDNEMWRRWLYTAVTRAEEELFIVG